MSIDENGIARLERLSFDAYNESDVLISSIQRYFERTGHYPERVLVDQIYRNRKNRAYCKERDIRMSGPALGRPKQMTPEAHRQSYNDNVDRKGASALQNAVMVSDSFGQGSIQQPGVPSHYQS